MGVSVGRASRVGWGPGGRGGPYARDFDGKAKQRLSHRPLMAEAGWVIRGACCGHDICAYAHCRSLQGWTRWIPIDGAGRKCATCALRTLWSLQRFDAVHDARAGRAANGALPAAAPAARRAQLRGLHLCPRASGRGGCTREGQGREGKAAGEVSSAKGGTKRKKCCLERPQQAAPRRAKPNHHACAPAAAAVGASGLSRLRRCTTRWGLSPSSRSAPVLLPPHACGAGAAVGAGVPGPAAARAAAMLVERGGAPQRAGVPAAVPLPLAAWAARRPGEPKLDGRLPLPAVRIANMALMCSCGTPAARAAIMVPRWRPSECSRLAPARWLAPVLLPPATAGPRLLAELQLLVLPSASAASGSRCGPAGSPAGRPCSAAAAWRRCARPRWLSSATCRIAPAPWLLAPASREAAAWPPRWLRLPWMLPSR